MHRVIKYAKDTNIVESYTEYKTQPTNDGCIDISLHNRHGHLIEFRNSVLSKSLWYENGNLQGLQYYFSEKNQLDLVDCICNGSYSDMFTYFPSGGISTYQNKDQRETKHYHPSGLMDYWKYSEGDDDYTIQYKKGRPVLLTIQTPTCRWVIKWSDRGIFTEINHYQTNSRISTATKKCGLSLSLVSHKYQFSFYDENGNDVTATAINMCVNSYNITIEEETMMTLAFGSMFRVTVPDIIRDDYERFLSKNHTKFIINE